MLEGSPVAWKGAGIALLEQRGLFFIVKRDHLFWLHGRIILFLAPFLLLLTEGMGSAPMAKLSEHGINEAMDEAVIHNHGKEHPRIRFRNKAPLCSIFY